MTNLLPSDIIHGLHICVQEADAERERVREEHFTDFKKRVVDASVRYDMKEYAPNVYADIRARNGVDTEQFLESFSVPEAEYDVVTQSTGRSGSFFYKTHDRMFFYKTLLYPEVETLKLFLPEYHKHLRKYRKSFIMRMFGLYRITAPGSSDVWILVMGSVFPRGVVMDEIFDLKGRKPKPGKHVDERGVISNAVLKDNEIKRKLDFEHLEDRFFFNTQLERDVKLLSQYQIMDYSLLVGVHYITDEEWENYLIIEEIRNENIELKNTRHSLVIRSSDLPDFDTDSSEENEEIDEHRIKKREAKRKLKSGEIRSIFDRNAISGINPESETREVFFFGIIDCLTGYAFGKKVANFFKQFLWDKETLSTVKANFYSERFLNFMENELIYDESIHTNHVLEEPQYSSSSEEDSKSITSKKSERRVSLAITNERHDKPRRSSDRRKTISVSKNNKTTSNTPSKTAR